MENLSVRLSNYGFPRMLTAPPRCHTKSRKIKTLICEEDMYSSLSYTGERRLINMGKVHYVILGGD